MSYEDEIDRRLRAREDYQDAMLGLPPRRDSPEMAEFMRLLDASSLGTLEAKIRRLAAPEHLSVNVLRYLRARRNRQEPTMTELDVDIYPYRIVDIRNQGWWGDGEGNYEGYDPSAPAHERKLERRPLADITRDFGPWRPVEPYTPAERAEVRAALELAGRKAIGSVVAAVEQVYQEARERYDEAVHGPGTHFRYAQRSLTAGRPSSWEAPALLDLTTFGNQLNLHPRKANAVPAEMRATGPNPRRVDKDARDRLAAVVRAWTTSDDRYVEVAESLASLVAFYADDTYPCTNPGRLGDQAPCEPGCIEGWRHVADQWLQPDQPNRHTTRTFVATYRLFYYLSAHHNTDLY